MKEHWPVAEAMRFALDAAPRGAHFSIGPGDVWLSVYVVADGNGRHVRFWQDGRVDAVATSAAAPSGRPRWLSLDPVEWREALGL